MPYVSIDIEPTGLDPDTCQVLEVGAVADDWVKPINPSAGMLQKAREQVIPAEVIPPPQPGQPLKAGSGSSHGPK